MGVAYAPFGLYYSYIIMTKWELEKAHQRLIDKYVALKSERDKLKLENRQYYNNWQDCEKRNWVLIQENEKLKYILGLEEASDYKDL